MNGDGRSEEDMEGDAEKRTTKFEVLMCGYLPGVVSQKPPLVSPVAVASPESGVDGDSWKDVCGGGCGFAMAIAESGKLITWGSADDQGQSYLTSGKHGETPEPFQLPTETPIMKASAGWAHCVSLTEKSEVYTWGWKECVPSVKITRSLSSEGGAEGDTSVKQSSALFEQGLTVAESPRSQGSKSAGVSVLHLDNKKTGEETPKRRKVSPFKQEIESPPPADESLSAPPCLVALDPGIKITSVAAGGRHTLALSDVGQVWGWGYGGEGQLGLGSRIKIVASPHLIPCIEPATCGKERTSGITSGTPAPKVLGSYIKGIACGGRHSAVITDSGALLTFGWGLYGQCGQGSTNDVLRPTCVPSLLNTRVEDVAAGLWHTLCICADGRVHAFGGNQFGQLGLGTGTDQSEVTPRLVDATILESKNAKKVSCGARHSTIMTEDAKVYSWGWNKYGQLGLGDTIDRNIPAQVPLDDYTLKNIACGWWHTLLLAETLR
nr:ultraviolet-B receptor UVR8-like isoform X2 [Ipomoea batatas]